MNDPDIVAKLQPVDNPVGVAALFQNQLPDARTEALQGLGDIRREPIGDLRQGTSGRLSRVERKTNSFLAYLIHEMLRLVVRTIKRMQ